jgi:hypothetical protein
MEAMLQAETHPSPPASAEKASATPPTSAANIDILAEGTYYKSSTSWIKLQQLTLAGGGAAHVGKMFVPGLTPQIVWTYRGAEAPIQIVERTPTFVVKQSPYMANVAGHSDRDLVMVRFNRKKDHRELQFTSGGNMFTFKAGFSKEKLVDIVVTRISDTTFSITPAQELSPGEYLLTFGAFGANGFDFGIKPEK